MGWQRSLAAGRGRNPLLCISATLCEWIQRLLSAVDDGAVAVDSARDFHRVPQSCAQRRLGTGVGLSFLRIEPLAGGFLRRGFGQRSAWRAARWQRILF